MRFKLIYNILLLSLISCNSKSDRLTTDGKELNLKTLEKTTESELKTEELNWPSAEKAMSFLKEYGNENSENKVVLKTRLGNITIQLYDDTPLHRANFIFNTKRKLYEKTIFYRVVPDFMIQGGNSDYDKTLEMRASNSAYYVTNEVQANHIHKKGAVAMAMTYIDNPEMKSAQYSYYIVIGKIFDAAVLEATEKEYKIKIPEENKLIYKSLGGTPHLDGVHTVFGEVIEGIDVVEAISKEKTDSGDWPINDVIIDCEVLKD
ncbi:MAG: peptidylprolyl isomerase [Salibacteraceae bacterium]|jgi:peptidyl-prolyl cis-trans isomerase A (cyclophilin A)|nr:peptidylprolyl isomerase [Salibacteraceae bacterium]MDP4764209.1 peptidylprolyl isomerase [Salibacteraceae bacterium]MDP4843273.1 peptidylprolyl isomerase [Salibacteraceae bacterium]MDP4933893.1 peptidylprolyl isomerase [Salibacteraceae bacterium]MDP4965305.1 peptidylprolyl isomerase [Salibacteraceae bacterium]